MPSSVAAVVSRLIFRRPNASTLPRGPSYSDAIATDSMSAPIKYGHLCFARLIGSLLRDYRQYALPEAVCCIDQQAENTIRNAAATNAGTRYFMVRHGFAFRMDCAGGRDLSRRVLSSRGNRTKCPLTRR
jgi:hypothetical protein